MGKINQGILGGFSGKVGTVVGGSWKGTAYMRGLPTLIIINTRMNKHFVLFAMQIQTVYSYWIHTTQKGI